MKAKFVRPRDIMVTIPASIKWDEYQKEIDSVKDGKNVMNFKVTNFPTNSSIGNKCYLCHQGYIMGWMNIVGFEEKDFICSTTGKKWKGKFIQRSGPFYPTEHIPMKGFRGFKYV